MISLFDSELCYSDLDPGALETNAPYGTRRVLFRGELARLRPALVLDGLLSA